MLKKLSAIFGAAFVSSCCIIGLNMTNTLTAEAADIETQASDNLTIGDVDFDNNINVLDAASILSEAAILGTSGVGTFTEDQLYCADVNTDGKVDAVDASLVLGYAAYSGTGGSGDMVSYLEQLAQSGQEETEDTTESATTPETTTTTTTEMTTTTETTTTTTATTTAATTTVETTTAAKPLYDLTESEATMLAALVTLEAGNESYECQKAVASIVINRMLTSNSTLSEVIYAKNQFSTASKVASTTPFDSCVKAVDEVLTKGTTLPIYVTFFRASYYHSWGDQVAYCCIDNTYFSYSQALMNQYK